MVGGWGFMMNNEMDDFSTNPESVNKIEPGKKPLSSMSPTVKERGVAKRKLLGLIQVDQVGTQLGILLAGQAVQGHVWREVGVGHILGAVGIRQLKRLRKEGDILRGVQALVDTVNKYGGVMTMEDLAAYEVQVHTPVTSTYRGYKIISSRPYTGRGRHKTA